MLSVPKGRSADSARRFMEQRGHPVEPIGCIEIDELCTYYYFETSHQLVELEVVYSPRTDAFTRTVTGVRLFSEHTVVVKLPDRGGPPTFAQAG